MEVEFLARLQFAFTVAFHYIYPPLSIGLGLILVIVEAMWLWTGLSLYHQMARFWTRVFALTFAIGVATGIVMEFEFGTNWATYSRYVGDVFGSALAAEGIFAFFLESGFLAVLVFGWDKVSRPVHFIATCMVCFGAHFSAIWIVVANSWQQTPAGFHIVGNGLQARAEITDFWAMVFNPSALDRVSHVYCGCWQAGAFLVISISAWYLLRKKHVAFSRASMKIGLAVAMVASLLQLSTGHSSAEGVAEFQPAKLAGYEGHYHTGSAGMYLLGWVDEKGETTHGLQLPGVLSWLVHGKTQAPVTGLDSFSPKDRPPVNFIFQTYHAMVAIGMGLIGISALSLVMWWRGSLFDCRWWQWVLVASVMGPQLANQLGWFSAEVGRQPWIVYGLLRTSDALSKVVTANQVLTSLIMFFLIYSLLFATFVFLLNDKIHHGPAEEDLYPSGKLAVPKPLESR